MRTTNSFLGKVIFLNVHLIFLILLININSFAFHQKPDQIDISIDTLKSEILKAINDEFTLWYPLCIDTTYGGFFSDINYKWELDGKQNKMIVSQARHTWSTSNAFKFYGNRNDLIKIAEHGFNFLKDFMWDKKYGGFYDLVDRKGTPIKEDGLIIKRAYGNSFAIYGLASYYSASGNTEALELAKQTFYWLENHSYDSERGGYFQFISEDGKSFKEGFNGTPPKDQNSSIHLLESFTELYKVWHNELLGQRLQSLLAVIRDKITTEKGYMNLFFDKDWKPVSFRNADEKTRIKNFEFDHVSFGHDIETAYLIIEAENALGTIDKNQTIQAAKKMIDHTLKFGWDNEPGGIFDAGYYFNENDNPVIIKKTKVWWAQAEALNSLLIAAKLFSDEKNYLEKFLSQWNYIKKYLIDKVYGGWYWDGLDQASENIKNAKGSVWKVNYHTTRALINIIQMLKDK